MALKIEAASRLTATAVTAVSDSMRPVADELVKKLTDALGFAPRIVNHGDKTETVMWSWSTGALELFWNPKTEMMHYDLSTGRQGAVGSGKTAHEILEALKRGAKRGLTLGDGHDRRLKDLASKL